MAAKPNVAGTPRRWRAVIGLALLLGAPAAGAVAAIESLHLLRDGRELAMDPAVRLVPLRHDDQGLRLKLAGPASGDGARGFRIWLMARDRGWTRADSARAVILSVPPPGSYPLRLSISEPDGTWTELPGLMLMVAPPWWRSELALAAAGIFILALLVALGLAQRVRLHRRHAWQLALARQQLAEQHSEAKSRFLATLGHEIRTPMTGVLGMAELLQGSGLDASQRARVDAIEHAGRHLLRLVNDALDLARIEAGKLVLEDAPFELRPLLEEVADLLRPLARAKALAFSMQCEPGVPAHLRGDATRLRQILFNLGHNAIKFSERGGVDVAVGVREAGGIVLRVRDDGPGLSRDQQERLFRRFEQGSDQAQSGYGGSGLGLAICRELAAAMGGTITVSTEPGCGAVFRVELPLHAAPAPALRAIAGHAGTGQLRLLLVEDDAMVAEVAGGLLRRAGHEVVHAGHGLAAMAELSCGSFDVAILDLDLPGIDGIALARLLRDRGCTLPLLALTARADPDAEPAARAAGMDGFLRKPASGERLCAAVRALAASGRAGSAGGAAV